MSNARYWTAILYPEHLIDGWQDKIQDLLEVSYCYYQDQKLNHLHN